MKTIKIAVIVLITLPLGWYALIMMASESGEVVSLYTQDESGETKTTRLWIVDHESVQYLRSGNGESGWFKRIKNADLIELERKTIKKTYKPELAPALRDPVNRLMASKYGWAETCIDFFFSRADAVPVRLVPQN